MIDRTKFINTADALTGSYEDYGRCVYSISYQNNILDEVYDFMTNNAKDVNDLDWHVYKLLGEPEPYVVVDNIEEARAKAVATA